jgi:hypothetical protein
MNYKLISALTLLSILYAVLGTRVPAGVFTLHALFLLAALYAPKSERTLKNRCSGLFVASEPIPAGVLPDQPPRPIRRTRAVGSAEPATEKTARKVKQA